MNDSSRQLRLKPPPLPLKRAQGAGEAPHGAAPASASSVEDRSPALATMAALTTAEGIAGDMPLSPVKTLERWPPERMASVTGAASAVRHGREYPPP